MNSQDTNLIQELKCKPVIHHMEGWCGRITGLRLSWFILAKLEWMKKWVNEFPFDFSSCIVDAQCEASG